MAEGPHTRSENSSKLTKLLFRQKWRRVRHVLATKNGINEVKTGCCPRGLTALSIAVNYDPPYDIIEKLLRIEPIHSFQVDSYGMLPLHIACMNGASPENIKLLLDHDQGVGAQAIDASRRAPLHYAVQYVCQPHEISESVNGGSRSSGLSSLSTSVDYTATKRVANSCSQATNMTMAEDKFQAQIRVIELLAGAAPDILFFSDKKNRTPIDILQDCIAESREGSKWERASIMCSILRDYSVQLYREHKHMYEIQGFHQQRFEEHPSVVSSKNSTTESVLTGLSQLSKMEIDCTSYNQMDVSCNDNTDEPSFCAKWT